MGTSNVGRCGTVLLYTCLCVSFQRAYLNFVFMTWHSFHNHWQISSWWNRAGQNSLEAIDCKYHKKEFLLISALVSVCKSKNHCQKPWFLTSIFWLTDIRWASHRSIVIYISLLLWGRNLMKVDNPISIWDKHPARKKSEFVLTYLRSVHALWEGCISKATWRVSDEVFHDYFCDISQSWMIN
jgi:hypothetical protein